MTKEQLEFSKYERARILGARALQISMDAPLLMKIDEKDLGNLNFDPLKIAQKELDSGVLPITVNRPMPIKRDEKLKEIKIEELEKDDEDKDKDKDVAKEAEEKEDGDEVAPAVSEERITETTDMKSDEEVEEEIESEGIGDDAGGADEGGSSDE